jgi:hypothetical protein
LDYVSSVWAAHKSKLIDQIEGFQRRATKQVPGMKHLSYSERISKLGLPTLSYRRMRGDMIEMCKMIKGKYNKTSCDFIKLWTNQTRRSCNRGHGFNLFPQRVKLDLRKHSFTVRTSEIWNNLPDHVVNAKTLNAFKNRLEEWVDQEIKCDN